LESGKVLHFTNLEFPVSEIEQQYFTSGIRDKKSRNIRATCKITNRKILQANISSRKAIFLTG
jgi:hypothetical protein